MTSTQLSQRLTMLRLLIEELGAVLEQWRTTSYPEVHRFLARTLSSKLLEIAEEVCTDEARALEEQGRCA